jgi:hypothetical protein
MKFLEKQGKAKTETKYTNPTVDLSFHNDYMRLFINSLSDIIKISNEEVQGLDNLAKKLLPFDLCIASINDWKEIYYFTVIYQYLINDYLGIDTSQKLREHYFEEVIVSKEHELEKYLYIPFPFKEVLLIDDKTENSGPFISLDDSFIEANRLVHDFYTHLALAHFNIDKVTDEFNDMNKSNKIIKTMLLYFLEVFKHIDERNLISSLNCLKKILSTFLENKNLFHLNPNAFKILYLQYLVSLFIFSPETAKKHYISLTNELNIHKTIEGNSLEKIITNCKFFISILAN